MTKTRQIRVLGWMIGLVLMTLPQLAAAQLANPSAELPAATGDGPAAWTAQIWGDTQGELIWSETGAEGSRSLQVAVTATDATGDARWLSDAVSISGGVTYRLSVRYHSTAAARLAAMALGDNGQTQWLHITNTAPATDWSSASATFVPPAWATQLRVGHLLAKVGTLWTDDYKLIKEPVPPRLDGSSNVIANPSFEIASADEPANAQGWSFVVNGAAKGTGAIVAGADAFAGERFARATLTTAATDADVKWWTAPISVSPGDGDWLLTTHTRGDGRVLLGLHLTMKDGQTSWRLLKWAERSETWVQTGAATALPATIDTVRVAAIVTHEGLVDLDDFSLMRADAGGDPTGPLWISVAIDAAQGDLAPALATLAQRKVLASFYVPTSRLDGKAGAFVKTLHDALDAGHEIGAFGEEVATWAQSTTAQKRAVVIRAYSQFRELGLGLVGFAPPENAYDDAVVEAVDSAGGYLRTLNDGTNYPPAAYLNVQVRDVTATTTTTTLARWANEARRHSAWLVLRYADVGPAGAVTAARLGSDIDAMIDAGASFLPVGAALKRWPMAKESAPTPDEQTNKGWFGCSAGGRGSARGLLWLVLLAIALLVIRRRIA